MMTVTRTKKTRAKKAMTMTIDYQSDVFLIDDENYAVLSCVDIPGGYGNSAAHRFNSNSIINLRY